MNQSNNNLPSKDILFDMFYLMIKIRMVEEAILRLFKTENMPGTIHQSNGMEAICAGVAYALLPNDLMASTHRGHGHLISKGCSLNSFMAELYGKGTGLSKGVGGSMHMFDLDKGFLGTNGIVGGSVPIAVGASLAMKLEAKKRLVISFFGDGASNEGAVHEAMNLASVWKLPIIFIIENNQYAVSTKIQSAINIDHLANRGNSYGISGYSIDGNNAIEVYNTVKSTAKSTREGLGPSLIECITYRYQGHSRFEPGLYRDEEEVAKWKTRDPIEHLRKLITETTDFDQTKLEKQVQKIENEINNAIQFAQESPSISMNEIYELVFAD